MTANKLPDFLSTDYRLLLFGGKGGVGKTTCASAAAFYLAKNNPSRKFLLASTDPAHSLADCFAGPSPLPNLELNEIDAIGYLSEFKSRNEKHLRTIAMRGTFLDNADIDRLMDLSLPGMDEIVALLELADRLGDYASVILDTAPAGHTLRLLELPKTLRQWVAALDAMSSKYRYMSKLYAGAYRKDATDAFLLDLDARLRHLGRLLKDPGKCRFVPILLAEELSIGITGSMIGELKKLRIPVKEMVVNRLFVSKGEGCEACNARGFDQALALGKLQTAFPEYALWGLPYFENEVRGPENLASLWASLLRPVSGETGASSFPGRIVVDNPVPLLRDSLRLVLFAGKGGVGKTTLACACAVRLSEAGRSILLFSVDPAHSLSACFGREIGDRPTLIAKGLSAMELDARAEFFLWKARYRDEVANAFKSGSGESGAEIAFDREVMERIGDLAPPGLDEILAVVRIVELMQQDAYSLFILDTAPTGHLLRFLEMPELVEEWLRTFFGLLLKYREMLRLPRLGQEMVELSKRVKEFRRMLADSAEAELMLVAIPTMLAYEETKDLAAGCRRLKVRTGALFLNMVTKDSICGTCKAMRNGELPVILDYEAYFANHHIVRVYRQAKLCGIDRLGELGNALFL